MRKFHGRFPKAGARRWIIEHRLAELQDHMQKKGAPTHCSPLGYLVAAVRQDSLDAKTARAMGG